MIPEIILTSPNPQLTVTIKKVAEQLGEEVAVVESSMEDAAQIVRRMVESGKVKVVISRAGTAELIRKTCSVPVINADSTNYDRLRAFLEAKKTGKRIGFLAWEHVYPDYDISTIEEILGVHLEVYRYKCLGEVKHLIHKAANQGIEVMVGGGIRAIEWSKEAGMQAIMIANKDMAIRDALIRARAIINDTRRNLEHIEQFKAVVNSSEDGIIALDSANHISFINVVAQRMFGIDARAACGTSIQDYPIIPFMQLKSDQANGKVVSEVQSLRLVAGQVPVIVDGQEVGSVITVRDVTKLLQLEEKIRKELYQKGLTAKFSFNDIVAESGQMKKVLEKARRYAETSSTLLIIGESGTGKELLAQGTHLASPRRDGPFVAVNCAALPENLLESELFGYEEGSFTGAKKGGKPGLFELAHGGTIFLDEIGSITLSLQGRLLRVLQEREVMRVGGDKVIPVDIRVISATNEDLNAAIKRGTFRQDLYFRLNVLSLQVPPMRRRREDIPLLFSSFVQKFNKRFDRRVSDLPIALYDFLNEYGWPGNVRELENLAERYVILAAESADNTFLFRDLFQELQESSYSNEDDLVDVSTITVNIGTLDEMEKQLITKVQERIKNKADLADSLGISRTTLWKKMVSEAKQN